MVRPRNLTGSDLDGFFEAANSGKKDPIRNTAHMQKYLTRKYPIRFTLARALFTWVARRAKAKNGMTREDARWLL